MPLRSPYNLSHAFFRNEIAKDSECEYVGLLASHIKRESEKTRQALAARSRLSFIEMRVAREFGDYLLSRRDAPEGCSR